MSSTSTKLIGAHISKSQVTTMTKTLSLNTAQIFLGSPRSWRLSDSYKTSPPPLPNIPIYAHANYLINPCSADQTVREKSIASLQQHIDMATALNIQGLIVHAGQAGVNGTIQNAINFWHDCVKQLNITTPLLIENTAGGKAAPGRSLESFEQLWDKIGDFNIGYCLDTCHAWTGEFGLDNLYERLIQTVGIPPQLIHLNGSKDRKQSGRDNHSNLNMESEQTQLSLEFARNCDAPIILETPGKGGAEDLALLRRELN